MSKTKFKDYSENYSTFLRPNYETAISIGWLGSAAALKILSESSKLPLAPSAAFISVAALFGLWYATKGYKVKRVHKKLQGTPVTFTDFDKLKKIVNKNPDTVWWGDGFVWTTQHAQMAYEIMKDGQLSGMIDLKDPDKIGQRWLHGIGDSEQLFQALKHTEGHTLITGTTGAGKTRMFDTLISQALIRGETIVVIDPKGDKELKENMRYACEQMGTGHKFCSFHPAFPQDSVRINPLRNYTRPTEVAARIMKLWQDESGGGSDFKKFSWNALNNVIQAFDMLGERVTIVLIKRFLEDTKVRLGELVVRTVEFWAEKNDYISSMKSELSKIEAQLVAEAASGLGKGRQTTPAKAEIYAKYYYERIQSQHPSVEIDGLLSMYKHDATHFQKMVAGLLPNLSQIATGDVGKLLSPDANDIDDERIIIDSGNIVREKLAFYVGLDTLSDKDVGSAVGSMFLADMASVAGARYNFGVGDGWVNIFVDEAAETINDSLIQLLNKGRGAKIRLWIATQVFADFVVALGSEEKARQVLGNCNNKISLRIVDADTQEYVTKDLPLVNIKTRRLSQGTSASSDSPLSFGNSISESLVEQESPLVQPAFLGMLPNLEFFAVLSGGNLFKGKVPILTRK